MRYRRGRYSAEGFYRDSFNLDAVIESLLLPLGPGGSRRYRTSVFNHFTDAEDVSSIESSDDDAILVFDGIFVHRPELLPYWDFTIFLDVRFEVTVARNAQRFGLPDEVEAVENRRYVEGQRLYLNECDPKSVAAIVVDNNDLDSPNLVRV